MSTGIFKSGVIFQDGSVQVTATPPNNRNLILNGAFRVDQRNLGAVSAANTGGVLQYIGPDRWYSYGTLSTKFTLQQMTNTDYRALNFPNYLKVTSLSTFTITTTNVSYTMGQRIPLEYTKKLKWGVYDDQTLTGNAGKAVTLSFWTYSNNTGLHSGAIINRYDNVSTFPVSFPFSYTVNAANTWEYKTILIPPPPYSIAGTPSTPGWYESVGMTLIFCLGAASNILAATVDTNTWTNTLKIGVIRPSGSMPILTSGTYVQFAGVQLEMGGLATEYEIVEVAAEMMECYRYFRRTMANTRANNDTTLSIPTTTINFSSMRAVPTATLVAGSRSAATGTPTVVIQSESSGAHRCPGVSTGTVVAENDIVFLTAEI